MSGKKWTLDVESNQYELVEGKTYLIGCKNDNGHKQKYVDIEIESHSVDVKHSILDVTGTTLCILDLYSELGTFLNGKRLEPMFKERIINHADIRFGEITGRLYANVTNKLNSLEHNSSTELFLAPIRRAPRSSLCNTSTRLFSSPDVSQVGYTSDDSFNIPETQSTKQRNGSIVNSSMSNATVNQSKNSSFQDDSFIPETQMPPTAVEQTSNEDETLATKRAANLTQQNMQQTDEFIRMCTQDFNENIFNEGEVGEHDVEAFTSMIIPKIQHKPVVLTHEAACEKINKDVSMTSACDAEMEALNWSAAHTTKSTNNDESLQNAHDLDRNDVCTPDLFDLPELAEINMPINVGAINELPEVDEPAMGETSKTPEKREMNKRNNLENGNGGDGYAEEIDLVPTQVYIPPAKPTEPRLEQQLVVEVDEKELGLSGKENIPNMDVSLEQTQIFPGAKDVRAMTAKCYAAAPDKSGVQSTATDFANSKDLSSLPPTQIFSNSLNNSAQQLTKNGQVEDNAEMNTSKAEQQKLHSTLLPDEKAKSVVGYFADIEDTTENEKEGAENTFKKPQRSTNSSTKSTKSKRSKETTSSNIANNTQNETEEFDLCTPKWIVDNLDDIQPMERDVAAVKKRMTFGSDSEEEEEQSSVDLTNLVAKKDSKDFELLLANLKKTPTIATKTTTKSTNVLIKQEKDTETRNKTPTKAIEDTNTNKNTAKAAKEEVNAKKASEEKPTTSNTTPSATQQKTKLYDGNKAKLQQNTQNKCVPSKDKNEQIVEKSNRRETRRRQTHRSEEEPPKRATRSASKEKITTSGETRRQTNTSGAENTSEAEPPKRATRSASKEKITTTAEPAAIGNRRLTRLRSKTIDLEDLYKERSSSTVAGPTEAKQRKLESNDEIEAKKTRRTRSRSKTESQQSNASTKSSASVSTMRQTRKRKNSSEEQQQQQQDTHKRSYSGCSDKSVESVKSANTRNSTRSSTSTMRATRTRKASSDEPPPTQKKANDARLRSDNSAAATSKSARATRQDSKDLAHAGKSNAAVRERKRSTDVAMDDDESKRLKSSARTLQVAMSMVEPKLFQALLDNSPGNWCLASDPTNADVLVMDKGNRTLKFLIAMAKGIPIVTSKWLESLNSTKTVPRDITYFFQDKEFEKRHKFSLLKSLELARKSKIFDGYDFLTTSNILPQPAEMKQIIECAGGKVHNETPPPSKPNQKIYVISSWNDKKHWHKFRRGNANVRITSSEGIMESVMRQTVDALDANLFA